MAKFHRFKKTTQYDSPRRGDYCVVFRLDSCHLFLVEWCSLLKVSRWVDCKDREVLFIRRSSDFVESFIDNEQILKTDLKSLKGS